MAPHFPLYISRSDGRLETISLKTKKKESNAPTEAQLNANREVNGNRDFYKAIEVGDAKEVDWRRKLGGMLMKEIGNKEHSGRHINSTSNISILTCSGQKYILGALPENYRLFEHVKVTSHEVTGSFIQSFPTFRIMKLLLTNPKTLIYMAIPRARGSAIEVPPIFFLMYFGWLPMKAGIRITVAARCACQKISSLLINLDGRSQMLPGGTM